MASVQELARTFRVRWREDGKPQSETLGTRAEAEGFAADVERNGNRWPEGWIAGLGYARARSWTVAEWMTEHTDSEWCSASPETKRRYHAHIRDHIAASPFGALTITAVTRLHVLAWMNELAASGKSHKTIKNLRGEFSAAMTHALNEGMIAKHPVAACPVPNGATAPVPPVFLSQEQIAGLIDALPVRRKLVYETLAESGIRWGELRDLLASRVVRLPRSGAYALEVFSARKHSSDGNHRSGTTKTKSSKRTVSLPDDLGRELYTYAQTRPAGALLFALESDGNEWRIWNAAVIAAGLEHAGDEGQAPRVHDLRHSHASELLLAGVPLAKVSKRLGHKNIAITSSTYIHVLPDDDEVVSAINGKPRLRASARMLRSAS